MCRILTIVYTSILIPPYYVVYPAISENTDDDPASYTSPLHLQYRQRNDELELCCGEETVVGDAPPSPPRSEDAKSTGRCWLFQVVEPLEMSGGRGKAKEDTDEGLIMLHQRHIHVTSQETRSLRASEQCDVAFCAALT